MKRTKKRERYLQRIRPVLCNHVYSYKPNNSDMLEDQSDWVEMMAGESIQETYQFNKEIYYGYSKITVVILEGPDHDYGTGVAICSNLDYHLLVEKLRQKGHSPEEIKNILFHRGRKIAEGRALKALQNKRNDDRVTRFDVISSIIACGATNAMPIKNHVVYKSGYLPSTYRPFILKDPDHKPVLEYVYKNTSHGLLVDPWVGINVKGETNENA